MLGRLHHGSLKNDSVPLPLAQCLAKSVKTIDNDVIAGRTVMSHCQIVGQVARAMINRMPAWLRVGLFPDGSELIAAAHDIGKSSPTFQLKIYSALTQQNTAVLHSLKMFNADSEKDWGGHAGVSQASAAAANVGDYIPGILGQHHGFTPNLSIYQATSEVFGGQAWHAQRLTLLAQLKESLACDFPVVQDALQAMVLAGLTTVSDWIGSGSLFNHTDGDGIDKIERALDEAGYIRPTLKSELTFFDVFGFEPKDTQLKLIGAANSPGVYVLEAPMGLGKTEAALYAAYQLMEKGAATGIYFALPTQLTSDKIHERVNQFLQCILEEDSSHKHSFLVHGNAWLKQFDMGEEGNPGGAWFAQGKRSILAPFAVGTIDQALMSVMNVKHGFVRTFGLAGKVVILDEVHSYDSYTGALLNALVKALRQLHCTVIILSATLTQERRGKLLGFTPASMQYPLITAQPNQAELAELAVVTIPDVTVKIQHHQKDRPALAEALLRAESGQQVLWIENTVKEAQDIYRELSARSKGQGIDCGLLHSRFTKNHRTENEDNWVTCFGKAGKSIRNKQGRILVGTQVLEQSLDIDADFLVTRIAPTDMLLQRLGRLWRHLDTLRPAGASREAWILSPELKFGIKDPEGAFGSSAKVYAPYILCRTLAVWNTVSQVALPSQIRTLIEDTYAKKIETGVMSKHLHQVEVARASLEQMALHGLSKGGNTLPEESAKTRYSEQESTDVLLIKSYQPDAINHGVWVTLLSNERLWVPTNGRSLPRDAWRNISAKLMLDTLKVADYLAPKALSRAQLSWLGDYFYLGKPEYHEDTVMLRVALVNADESLRSMGGDRVNDQHKTSYSATQGYVTTKFK